MNMAYTAALSGGIMIGLAATLYWFVLGRVLGISGILRGAVQSGLQRFRSGKAEDGMTYDSDEVRLWLVVGLLLGGLLTPLFFTGFQVYAPEPRQHYAVIILAGFLVGVGSTIGNGCTSGHGVCGMSRGSVRSIVATCTFMAAGFLTAYICQHVLK